MLRLRRKHIEDAAANGKLTGAFDLYAALVACARERLRQFVQRRSFTDREGDNRLHEQFGRHGALCCRLHGRDRETRLAHFVQYGKSALFVAARHTDYIRHHQLARGKEHDVTLGKAAQISGKPVRSVVIVGQNQHRTTGVQTQSRREVRLMDGRQTDRQHRRFSLINGLF